MGQILKTDCSFTSFCLWVPKLRALGHVSTSTCYGPKNGLKTGIAAELTLKREMLSPAGI